MGSEELRGGAGTLVFHMVPQKRRCPAAVYWAPKNVSLYRDKEGPRPVCLLITDPFSRATGASQKE